MMLNFSISEYWNNFEDVSFGDLMKVNRKSIGLNGIIFSCLKTREVWVYAVLKIKNMDC